MKSRIILTGIISLAVALFAAQSADARSNARFNPPNALSIGVQDGCPFIFPASPVAVAPNQPSVANQSTIGIINALCDVTLDFVGCGFTPTKITLGCDINGDGVSDISIPLKDIKLVNRLLLQATIPSLAATPGTAFPLVCCGGKTIITLSRTVTAGDDNVFGDFTQTLVCSIDLGIRAPVVISATPAEADCVQGQNQLIPGACFLLADGTPNVTSVFAVEKGNPNNIIQSNKFVILTSNLIDAFFQPGPTSAGKTFLIFVSGPNGTSRNLSSLPLNGPTGCPLGNEQGVEISFRCKGTGSSPDPGGSSTVPTAAVITGCQVERQDDGSFSLSVFGRGIRDGSTLTVGGVVPKKIKLRDPDPGDQAFTRIIVTKKFCENLPGAIVVTDPSGLSSTPVMCNSRCAEQ